MLIVLKKWGKKRGEIIYVMCFSKNWGEKGERERERERETLCLLFHPPPHLKASMAIVDLEYCCFIGGLAWTTDDRRILRRSCQLQGYQ